MAGQNGDHAHLDTEALEELERIKQRITLLMEKLTNRLSEPLNKQRASGDASTTSR
jgi:hypothetical protein